MRKKLLSVLLALTMVLSLVPTAAFAAGEPNNTTDLKVAGYGFAWNGNKAQKGSITPDNTTLPGGGVPTDDWMGQTAFIVFDEPATGGDNLLWFRVTTTKDNTDTVWGCIGDANNGKSYAFSFLNRNGQWDNLPNPAPENGVEAGTTVKIEAFAVPVDAIEYTDSMTNEVNSDGMPMTIPGDGQTSEAIDVTPIGEVSFTLAAPDGEGNGNQFYQTTASVIAAPLDDQRTGEEELTGEALAKGYGLDGTVDANGVLTANVTEGKANVAVKGQVAKHLASDDAGMGVWAGIGILAEADDLAVVGWGAPVDTDWSTVTSTVAGTDKKSDSQVTVNDETYYTFYFNPLPEGEAKKTAAYIAVKSGDTVTTYVIDFTGVTELTGTPVTEKYTVTFAAGEGGTGTMPAVEVNKASEGDTTYTLPASTFPVPSGKKFAGWLVGDDTTPKAVGTVITLTEDVTLTAAWEDDDTPPTPADTALTFAIATAADLTDTAGKLYGKDPAELGTFGATASEKTVTVTGTAKKITGWEAFSSIEAEQSGYYLPIKITVGGDEAKTVTIQGSKTTTVEVPANDRVIVLAMRLDALSGNTFTVKVGDEDAYTVNVANVEKAVNAEITQPETTVDTVDGVKTATTDVPATGIADAITAAKENAGTDKVEVAIDATKTGDAAKQAVVTLGTDTTTALANADQTKITTDVGTVTLPAEVLTDGDGTGKNLTLTVADTSTEASGSEDAEISYTIDLKEGDESVELTTPITVELPIPDSIVLGEDDTLVVKVGDEEVTGTIVTGANGKQYFRANTTKTGKFVMAKSSTPTPPTDEITAEFDTTAASQLDGVITLSNVKSGTTYCIQLTARETEATVSVITVVTATGTTIAVDAQSSAYLTVFTSNGDGSYTPVFDEALVSSLA